MSESLLSGRFGEPEGGRLLSQKEKAALENLIRNEVILNQIIVNEQTGGGTTVLEWAAFDEDAVEVEQGEAASLSCELVEVGTYKVTSSISGIGRPIVTPLSTASSVPDATAESHPWFTTTGSRDEFSAHYDPVTQKIWATDYSHQTVGGASRVAIGSPFNTLPDTYWYMPSAFPFMHNFKGNVMFVDLTYRIAIIQAKNQDSSINTTIFLNMDDLTLFPDDMQSISGGASQIVVTAYSDDYIFAHKSGGHELWSRDEDGIPDAKLITYSTAGGTGGIGHKHGFIEDNDGHFWFKNTSEWERYPTSGGGNPSRHAIPGGSYAVSDDLRAFKPSENSIYFVDTDFDHLWKISCDSPFTITQVTASPYGTIAGAGADGTIDQCTCMLFTHDFSKLIFIRGGDEFEYLLFVDPSDGSIDAAVSLPHEFSSDNYLYDEVAHWGNFIATTGDHYLQVINYTVGNGGTDLAFTPPLFGARRESLTEFIVEFWNPEALPQKVKMNCGFQIYIARDPS